MDLIEAYKNTRYKISKLNLEIRIGEHFEHLDELLLEHNAKSWAFITPYNPESQILSDQENEARFELLKEEVKDYTVFEGEGVGADVSWPAEKSLLILGIDRSEAERIGKHFKQNAIVFGAILGLAELIVLNERLKN